MAADPLIIGDDGRARCAWGDHPAIYRAYHDDEWGRPVTDDIRLFEKLSLEGFQAGLSWLTILRKREAFRAAFVGFDPARLAAFTPQDVTRLLTDASIVRHRGKIEAVIHNAGCALELIASEGSLAAFVWAYEPRGTEADPAAPRAQSAASRALARELRRRGWRFVGPTTVHSFLQAMGLVNEHVPGCVIRAEVDAARRALLRPAGGPPAAA
ncbi:MAG TPA: DNA-3-methyladenine glycosylase I [Solirubrobacteraceae bacterium]|nr:DNA-3-methyladenine glycosylase I [Solirubrobacteraceae bacterium]